ncbi:blastula protease 10-like [Amphiura filiformis]|uniref:blastula protease 10-like n=1 Tax=Amphiura filiformis TaxID=82378 RepID=UPI003B21019D
MEPLLKLVILFSLVTIGLAVSVDRLKRDNDKDEKEFNPEFVGEPPEERQPPHPSPYMHADMLFTKGQQEIYTKNKENEENDGDSDSDRIAKRRGMSNLLHRWPRNIVVYKISPNAEKYKKTITAAINEWQKYTCLIFKPANRKVAKKVGHTNYILIDGVDDSIGCSSYIGYIQREGQLLNLTDECTAKGPGSAIHELGHAIGYVHEQSRPDRDQYVTVHHENIIPNMENNFEKMSSVEVSTNGIPYDHASIMHYGSHYASKNDKSTIEVRHLEDRMNMGQRHELSRYDIKHANVMYDCPEVNECEKLDPCNNGGTCVDEEGSYKCECAEGWHGQNCDLGCEDDHKDCNFFAGSGDCVGGEYQGWMLITCKKSCGICQPYECKDIADNCEDAKSQGYCEHTYVDWATGNCQKTCGFCNFCNPAPCLNGAACDQFGAGYKCTCTEGFKGEHCETPTDEPAEETPVEPEPEPEDGMTNLGNGFCMIKCP